MPLIASIDVGTNTLRLLAAEVRGGKIIREALNLRETTRLGEGLKTGGGRLKAEARERTIRTLAEFSKRMLEAGVEGVSAVGTEALRRASDAGDFVREARDEAGIILKIIPAEEEARLTLLGVKSAIGESFPAGRKLVMDIGGGSTEIILTEDWSRHISVSIPIGAVSLFERFLINDPPTPLEMSGLITFCNETVLPRLKGFTGGDKPALVGTAGTITTLAAVDLAQEAYDPAKITGHVLGRERISAFEARLAGLPRESRRLIAGIESGREDIIVSGTLLAGVIMDAFGADKITVCDWGLREGNLLDYYNKKTF